MKKKIAFILLVGFITLFPIKAFAMLEVDENGNPITREVKEGEVTILMEEGSTAPDEGQGSEPNSISPVPANEQKAEDSVTSSDQTTDVIRQNNDSSTDKQARSGEEKVYTVQAENDLSATNTATEDKNDWIYIVISGIAGIALGSTATYLLKK